MKERMKEKAESMKHEIKERVKGKMKADGEKKGYAKAAAKAVGAACLLTLFCGCSMLTPAARSNQAQYGDIVIKLGDGAYVAGDICLGLGDGLIASADGGGDSQSNTPTTQMGLTGDEPIKQAASVGTTAITGGSGSVVTAASALAKKAASAIGTADVATATNAADTAAKTVEAAKECADGSCSMK
jgi:hypothetical protein